ncbi:MAG: stage V sporulation protein T [Coprococcus sp.]|nr:stage V sporulation protein T [Coprococcus sp.]
MKATGIVRRIDDLGRVVIPKEIRRTLRIREGDPLEIFTDREGEVILKKYSPIGELGIFARQYAESLAQTSGHLVCVTDTDQVVAAAGPGKKEFQEKFLTKQMEDAITRREQFLATAGEKRFTKVTPEQDEEFDSQVVSPIICEGDAIGAVAILAKEGKQKMGEAEKKLATCAAGFLGRQMEQ